MTRVEQYRLDLREIDDWDIYLLENSGLPGPRGNIELARAAALEGKREQFEHWLAYTPDAAPVNSPQEFLAFCGALGMGRLISEEDLSLLPLLRKIANDPRWRIREAVAMGLQMLGRNDMVRLLQEMWIWCQGSLLERRAAAAGLCEPDLLGENQQTGTVLQILDTITSSILNEKDRKSTEFIALRKGMGYCWSVAIAAHPQTGKPFLEKWARSGDKDVAWIVCQNLKKNRLIRIDPDWVYMVKGMVSLPRN